jgi:hypothetical protein
MTDEVTTQLMTIVERAVRPVLATKARKRGMREELLGHVTDVYDDEMAQGASGSVALVRTRERFGDPAAITRQLQQSVSRRSRFGGTIERYNDWGRRPGEPAMRLAFRHMRAGLAFSLLVLVLMTVSAVALDASRRNAWGFLVRLAVVEGMFLACGSFVLVWWSQNIGEALFADPLHRNWRNAAPYLMLSAICLPAGAFMVFALLVHDLNGAMHQTALACWLAPLAPLLFALVGRAIVQEQEFEARWSALSIDE